MNNKTIIGLIIVILVFGGIWYSASNNQKVSETTSVKFAYLPVVHGLPLFIAIEKGYFRNEGIQVEAIKFESPNQIVDALLSGQVDFGSAVALGITGIAESKNPGKLKVYAVNGEVGDNSGENIIVPINSNLKSISELKGKKLGILAGTIQWRTIAREILAKNNLDMDKDLTIIELAPSIQVQALASGQVDAILALEPIPTVAISQGVGKIMVKAPAKEFIASPFWYGADVVGTTFAKNNPKTTKKVVNAIKRAVAEVNTDFDENRQYLKNYTSLTEDLATKVPPVNYKTCEDLNEQDMSSIKSFYGIFTKHKVVSGEIDVNALLYCK